MTSQYKCRLQNMPHILLYDIWVYVQRTYLLYHPVSVFSCVFLYLPISVLFTQISLEFAHARNVAGCLCASIKTLVLFNHYSAGSAKKGESILFQHCIGKWLKNTCVGPHQEFWGHLMNNKLFKAVVLSILWVHCVVKKRPAFSPHFQTIGRPLWVCKKQFLTCESGSEGSKIIWKYRKVQWFCWLSNGLLFTYSNQERLHFSISVTFKYTIIFLQNVSTTWFFCWSLKYL